MNAAAVDVERFASDEGSVCCEARKDDSGGNLYRRCPCDREVSVCGSARRILCREQSARHRRVRCPRRDRVDANGLRSELVCQAHGQADDARLGRDVVGRRRASTWSGLRWMTY